MRRIIQQMSRYVGRGVRIHSSKFRHHERFFVNADSLLPEENRTFGVIFYYQGKKKHRNSKYRHPACRKSQINQTLKKMPVHYYLRPSLTQLASLLESLTLLLVVIFSLTTFPTAAAPPLSTLQTTCTTEAFLYHI